MLARVFIQTVRIVRVGRTRRHMLINLDDVANQKSNGRYKCDRIFSDSPFADKTKPPKNAPKWTINGYNGPLRRQVAHACDHDRGSLIIIELVVTLEFNNR